MTMKQISINNVLFQYDKNNIHVVDSYKVKENDIMNYLVEFKRKIGKDFTYKRSLEDMKIEWIAHNVLYRMGICKSRTKHVDINENETTLRKTGYSIIYKLFKERCK